MSIRREFWRGATDEASYVDHLSNAKLAAVVGLGSLLVGVVYGLTQGLHPKAVLWGGVGLSLLITAGVYKARTEPLSHVVGRQLIASWFLGLAYALPGFFLSTILAGVVHDRVRGLWQQFASLGDLLLLHPFVALAAVWQLLGTGFVLTMRLRATESVEAEVEALQDPPAAGCRD